MRNTDAAGTPSKIRSLQSSSRLGWRWWDIPPPPPHPPTSAPSPPAGTSNHRACGWERNIKEKTRIQRFYFTNPGFPGGRKGEHSRIIFCTKRKRHTHEHKRKRLSRVKNKKRLGQLSFLGNRIGKPSVKNKHVRLIRQTV